MQSSSARTLALITSLVSLGALSMSLYVPSLPAIQEEFGVDAGAVQRTLTFFLVGFAGAQLVIGPLSDRFGRKPVMLIGLIGYTTASLLCAMAPDIFWLTVGRFIQGFAACTGPVIGRAVVRDLFERQDAARAFGIIGTAIALVPALAPMIGGGIQVTFGWEATFLALAVVGLFLTGLAGARLKETIRERLPDAMSPVRLITIYMQLLRNRYYMGYALSGALLFGGFFAYATDAPFLFIGELGIAPDTFGMLMVFTVAGYASGTTITGKLSAYVHPRYLIMTGTSISVCGAILLIALSDELSLVRVIGPMCLYTLGFGLTLPASMAGAMGPFPRVAGSASALLGFIQMSAAGLSSVIVQPLYDGTAGALGFVVLGMSGCACLGYLILARGHTPAEETTTETTL